MPEKWPQRTTEANDNSKQPALTGLKWKKAGVVSVGLFRGTHTQADNGAVFTYAGSYKVAIDLLCRESMHLFGTIYTAGGEANFSVHGLVDHNQSFIGREFEAAVAWVDQHCEHKCMLWQASTSQPGHAEPPEIGTGDVAGHADL